MDSEVQCRKIEETVTEILKNADLEEATEYKVRIMAAERLGVDLSDMDHKRLVRRVVESFLMSLEDKVPEETKEVVQEQESRPNLDSKEVNGDGCRVICNLSDMTSVAIRDFRGKKFVSINDYHQKDGMLSPSTKGISLTTEQWSAFKQSVPAIEEAITKMETQIRSEGVRKQIAADASGSVTSFAVQGNNPVERKQIEADMCNSVTHLASQGLLSNEGKPVEINMSNSATPFTPQGLIPIETTRLDGKNYHCWAHQMEFFLKQLRIAYVLKEPCPSTIFSMETSVEEISQAKVAAQKWVDDDYICRRNILNSLSDLLYDQYSKKILSAKELWDQLKSVYNEDFGTTRSQVNKYIQFQMVDGVSILEQVQELHNIADSIIASGTWIDENFHVNVIISKLPPSWKECRIKLMHEEVLPLNMLMYRLGVEEELRYQNKNEDPFSRAHGADLKLENKFGQKKWEKKKPGMHWEIEKDNKVIICYICGKKGHTSRQCYHRNSYHGEERRRR